MPALDIVFVILTVQILLGGFDNLWHHELSEGLPGRVSARTEIGLHAARELIYAVVFLIFAWVEPHGPWAVALGIVLMGEILITLADFLEEDRTRKLPPLERVLHTVLAINYGVFLALLIPILWGWAQLPGALTPVDRGLWSLFFSLAGAGVLIWGVRDALAWITLDRRARDRIAPGPVVASGRTVLVTGATGFLGQDLVHRLQLRGDHLIILSRDTLKAAAMFGNNVSVVDDLQRLAAETQIDAIINLAGANVADMPWWDGRKQVLLDSRLTPTAAVIALVHRLHNKPQVLVNASAVGAYGNRGEAALPEHASRPLGEFTADLCRVWENEANRAAAAGVRVCCLRFGLIFGRDGSAFPKLALGRRFGVTPQFGCGRQWMSWVHKLDALRAIEFALDQPRLNGPINVVAPTQVRHRQVMRSIAGTGLLLPIPAILLKTVLGEMADLFLASQRVRPDALQAAGFRFNFPEIEGACQNLLARHVTPHEHLDHVHDTPSV